MAPAVFLAKTHRTTTEHNKTHCTPGQQTKYSGELSRWRSEFDRTFWNATLKTYSNDTLQIQTLSSIALGASAVPATRRHDVVKTLTTDVAARDYHLTVGSAGSKWLLRQLTAEGAHDHALKLATRTTQPSFGYWIAHGATTCWENWSGVQDDTHPCPGGCVNPPTHNHIFLCGGVGEWMYRSLGGISPVLPGYRTVAIAPAISATVGPSGVNATVSTVRGIVKSSWKRKMQQGGSSDGGRGVQGAELITLAVSVPAGATAIVSIPLLGEHASNVIVTETNANVRLWEGGSDGAAGASNGTASPLKPRTLGSPQDADAHSTALLNWLLAPARLGTIRGGVEEVVVVEVTSGNFDFSVCRKGK